MVIIFKYIFLGIALYILILPMLEELAGVITQALEILKGKAMYKTQKLQQQINDLMKETEETEKQFTNVIGFQVQEAEEDYEEDYDEDD